MPRLIVGAARAAEFFRAQACSEAAILARLDVESRDRRELRNVPKGAYTLSIAHNFCERVDQRRAVFIAVLQAHTAAPDGTEEPTVEMDDRDE